MTLVVQKYGGTSVGDPEKIKRVAGRIAETASSGAQVCVVVSAMGDTTDRLLELARAVSSDPHPREQDMLLTSGERISSCRNAQTIGESWPNTVPLRA